MLLANEILGIDPEWLNNGVAGLIGAALLLAMRVIWTLVLGDKKEVDIKSDLVHLASDSMERTDKMLVAYESNTEAIQQVGVVLVGVQETLRELVKGFGNVQASFDPLAETIEIIKDNLIRRSTTVVVLRDDANNDIAKFTAQPELDDNGSEILVVTFNELKEYE